MTGDETPADDTDLDADLDAVMDDLDFAAGTADDTKEHRADGGGEPLRPAGPDEATGKEVEGPAPVYTDAYEFAVDFLGSTVSRLISAQTGVGLRWDRQWWRYPEVRFRMELMWRTWEVANADPDPAAMESWTRVVMDHHLAVILSETGPMRGHGPQETIGAEYPPAHPRRDADERDRDDSDRSRTIAPDDSHENGHIQ